uniref:Uncharacterized protein n=1 Tax=viral metagenome TaxID=1070528 RepID=A0A6C0AWG3_9ZZZZ|tara:strand:- start:73 stop:435 length:363 start_codon:yes stop_codon:yes gene_type:complete
MDSYNEMIIPYNSKTYNTLFFKKHEKKGLLLKICKTYLKYVPTYYNEEMTLKLNASYRARLFNNFIDSFLRIILSKYNLLDMIYIIKPYIGAGIDNVYIEDKTWDNLIKSLNTKPKYDDK